MLTNYAVELYTEKKNNKHCISIVGDEEKKQRLYCWRKMWEGGGAVGGLHAKEAWRGGKT